MPDAKSKQAGLVIALKRSPIGVTHRHRLVLRGLGLRKVNDTVVRPDTPQVRGLIDKVGYLLKVTRHETA